MKVLKHVIAIAVLTLLTVRTAQSQTINFASNVPVYAAEFYRDSVTVNSGFAADTIFTSFRAPFKVNIVAWEVYMCTIDTGSAAAGEPSLTRSFALKKSTSGTALSTIIPTSASANVYSYNVTSFPARLNVGEIVRVKWTCGTGVRYKQVMVRIWYVRV